MAREYEGIPREKIPWWPTIDYEACVGCQECYNFCPNNVYDWDDENTHPLVARPTNCVVFCAACAKNCASEAISFPPKEQIVALLRELRK